MWYTHHHNLSSTNRTFPIVNFPNCMANFILTFIIFWLSLDFTITLNNSYCWTVFHTCLKNLMVLWWVEQRLTSVCPTLLLSREYGKNNNPTILLYHHNPTHHIFMFIGDSYLVNQKINVFFPLKCPFKNILSPK